MNKSKNCLTKDEADERSKKVKKVTLVEQSTIMLTKQKDVEINLGGVERK